MAGHLNVVAKHRIQSILGGVVLLLGLGVITWISVDMSRLLSRILSGIIVGSTATLIGFYVISLPNDMWIPWRAHRNILSFWYTLYALFVYCLSMIISPGSLFGMELGALLGYNPMCIIVGSFLLALYMTVGSVLDEVVSQTSRYVWLVFLITAVCYAWVTGIIVIGLSVDFLFITSLAVVRLVTSLALGPMLRERMTSGHLTTLRTSFIVLNLFVLPVTAVLS